MQQICILPYLQRLARGQAVPSAYFASICMFSVIACYQHSAWEMKKPLVLNHRAPKLVKLLTHPLLIGNVGIRRGLSSGRLCGAKTQHQFRPLEKSERFLLDARRTFRRIAATFPRSSRLGLTGRA